MPFSDFWWRVAQVAEERNEGMPAESAYDLRPVGGNPETDLMPCTAPSLESWAEELTGKVERTQHLLDLAGPAIESRDKDRMSLLSQLRFVKQSLLVLAGRQCASACLEKIKPEDPDIRYPDWRDRCAKHVAEYALRTLSAEPEAGK